MRCDLKKILSGIAAVAFLLTLACVPRANASSQDFVVTGTDKGGDPIDATVDFTTSNGKLVITIVNLEGSMHDAGQLVSDLSFSLNGGSISGSDSPIQTGTSLTVSGKGSATTGVLGASVNPAWAFSVSSGVVTFDGLGGANTPTDLVIGPGCSGGLVYCDATGNSIDNAHNPFISDLVITINDGNISSLTTVSNVILSFGTQSGDNHPGVPTTPTPEPASLLLLGTGLVTLGAAFRRRFSA